MKKILVPICMLLLVGCYYDKEDQLYPQPSTGGGSGCDTTNLSYATDIEPIMSTNCAIAGGCHDATAKSFGYDLSNYDGVKAAGGIARFLGAIKHESGISPMPKGRAKLGDCEISKVSAWINAGMPQ